jgi:large subunit ribosomal protein L10Ae
MKEKAKEHKKQTRQYLTKKEMDWRQAYMHTLGIWALPDVGASIHQLLEQAHANKRRKFVETVQLVIQLRNYSFRTDKRVYLHMTLPHAIRHESSSKRSVCVLAADENDASFKEAQQLGFPVVTASFLAAFNKNKKEIKKWFRPYAATITDSLFARKVPRLSGPALFRYGKPPIIADIPPAQPQPEPIARAYHKMLHLAKFTFVRRQPKFDLAIGHVEMTPKQLLQNIRAGTTALVGRLKNGWANVDEIGVHASMGSHFVLYSRSNKNNNKKNKKKNKGGTKLQNHTLTNNKQT